MMEKLPRRGQSWISGGSPAIRARVMRSCMMLMEPVITLHMPGVLGLSPRLNHWLKRLPPLGSSGSSVQGWCMSALRLTAITTSAPMARASEMGTGLTTAPSTSQRSSTRVGVRMPGMPQEARTHWRSGPCCNQISRPVSSSVATQAKGSGRLSMAGSPK